MKENIWINHGNEITNNFIIVIALDCIAAISHIRIACDKHKQNSEERAFRQEDKIKWLQKLKDVK